MIVTVRTKRIQNNLNAMRHAIGKPLVFMCKANAYGHGLCDVATRVKADVYGVATEKEGILLRSCVTAPIYVMAPRVSGLPEICAGGLIPLVGDKEYLRAVIESRSIRNCHIKVDSGMHRLGFSDPKECYQAASLLAESGVSVDGVCTHYKDPSDENVIAQNRRFDACISAVFNSLAAKGSFRRPFTHVTYSGAKYARDYDMLRVGLAAYGYSEENVNLPLKKAMEIFSEIICVKRIKKGESLGYGSGFIVGRDLCACTVLGGYADGIDRRDVGRNVLCNGSVGKIAAVCMDTFELVTDRLDLSVGDRVIIMSEEIDADYISGWRGTISYEVLVGYGSPRAEYVYDG